MKRILCILLCCLLLAPSTAVLAADPTTWSAVDGLGRTLTQNVPQKEKFVGMFYWTWHYPWAENYPPRNIREILQRQGQAVNDFSHPAWEGTIAGTPYFWDEPLFGYYSDLDEYVLRKHAELLADAGIDVIVFDCTNATETFIDGYETLFRVWETAKEDGVQVPQVAFMLNFGRGKETRTELLQLYADVYRQNRYADLWFYWKGRPLVMADVRALDLSQKTDREVFRFFTFRRSEATYFMESTPALSMDWGWCAVYPQTRFCTNLRGKPEQMTVSVAQNAGDGVLCAMNDPTHTVQGRAFAADGYSYSYTYAGKTVTVDANTPNGLLYGRNFQQQWDYAIAQDPEFIFVTGFNEWIAGRFSEWYGTENAFPDQFSPAYSRDIEPSRGVLQDHYYYQLVENVRRFKGTAPAAKTDAQKTIRSFADWDGVQPEYTHYTRSTRPRDADGWKGTHYRSDTMRNDIVSAKVAYDTQNVYFLVTAADTLSLNADRRMWLYLDTDASGCTPNWEGFEYRLRDYADGKVCVQRWNGTAFETVGQASYTVQDASLWVTVPREMLALSAMRFGFKWSDNMQDETDILDFYQNGDVAPGGRFCFVFDSEAVGGESRTFTHGAWSTAWQRAWESVKKLLRVL